MGEQKENRFLASLAAFFVLQLVLLLCLTLLLSSFALLSLFAIHLSSSISPHHHHPISVSVHNHLYTPLRCLITGHFLHSPPPSPPSDSHHSISSCHFLLSDHPSLYITSAQLHPWELRVLARNPNDGRLFQLLQEPLHQKSPLSSLVRSCRWDIDDVGVHYTWFDGQGNQLEETKTLCRWEIMWVVPPPTRMLVVDPVVDEQIVSCSSLADNSTASV